MGIALFGGSFNPVHSEHINIVKAALCDKDIDKVIIMPSNITPAKSGTLSVPSLKRLEMCRLAFEDIENAEVSDYEIKKGGISYTCITCKEFKEKFPEDKLYFIMGADMLSSFKDWKNPQEILNSVSPCVCARENEKGLTAAVNAFKKRFGAPLKILAYTGAKLSSTKIRTVAALGENVSEYTGEKTAEYIKENSLYKIGQIAAVKNYLTQERFKHTLNVAVMAAENCRRLNIDEETAITAAALHDCAKYISLSDKRLKDFVCPENVPEPVLHQFTGAYIAEKEFGITNADILNAIRYHTSGRENMSDLEILVFLCDLLEENRTFGGVEELRRLFDKDIYAAFYAALKRQCEYLKGAGKPVYALTERAYEYYSRRKNDKH